MDETQHFVSICNDTIYMPNKPTTDATTEYEDSNGAQTYRWLVPFDECGVTATLDNTDVNNVFTKYDLYLNANREVFKMKNSR